MVDHSRIPASRHKVGWGDGIYRLSIRSALTHIHAYAHTHTHTHIHTDFLFISRRTTYCTILAPQEPWGAILAAEKKKRGHGDTHPQLLCVEIGVFLTRKKKQTKKNLTFRNWAAGKTWGTSLGTEKDPSGMGTRIPLFLMHRKSSDSRLSGIGWPSGLAHRRQNSKVPGLIPARAKGHFWSPIIPDATHQLNPCSCQCLHF